MLWIHSKSGTCTLKSGSLIQIPILTRCYPGFLFEQPRKILRVFKTQVIGNFADGFIHVKNPFFGNIHHFGLDIFLCGTSGFFFNKVAKIIGRKIQFTSTPRHGGKVDVLGFFRLIVIVQQLFKLN